MHSEHDICEALRFKKLEDKEFLSLVLESLKDFRPRVRRYAAIAAGREAWNDDLSIYRTLEMALLKAWKSTDFDNEKRLIAESLGKIGTEESFALLESVKTEDVLLKNSIAKALLLFERRLSKQFKTQWQMNKVPPLPLPVRLWCRRGMESLLVRNFDSETQVEIVKVGSAWVDILLTGSPSILFKNRMFLNFGFPLHLKNSFALTHPNVIAEILFAKTTRQILAMFSSAPYRIRLEHAKGGHQRSLQWKIAEQISLTAKKTGFQIINDSRQADWEALVSVSESSVFLCPKSYQDPRFEYRVKDVPAASNFTIAAAMAYVAQVKETDYVWDPFVGSGTELIESYLQSPCRVLIGTDLEESALENVKSNMQVAGLSKNQNVILEKADASKFKTPFPISLVISNPPMGRRVPIKDVKVLLSQFIHHLPKVLTAEGRLVWMSPFPQELDKELLRIGMKKTFASKMDMGGFSAELQRWEFVS